VAERAREETANSRSGPGDGIREEHSGANAGSGARGLDQLWRDGIPIVRRMRVYVGPSGRGCNPSSSVGTREATVQRYGGSDDGCPETAVVRDREGEDDAIREGFGSGEAEYPSFRSLPHRVADCSDNDAVAGLHPKSTGIRRREIHLDMDSYSAHRCAAVKAVAEELHSRCTSFRRD
jgi:hypothetical protein